MQKKYLFHFTALLLILTTGCKKSDPKEGLPDSVVYMLQAVNQPFSLVPVTKPILATDPVKTTVNFGAFVAGYDPASADVTATFAVNPNGLTALNKAETDAGRAPYVLLPVNMYSIPALNALIKKGSRNGDPLSLIIDNEAITAGSKYALPITLMSVSGAFKLSEQLKTTIFTFNVLQPFNKAVFDNQIYKVVKDEWEDFAVNEEVLVKLGPGTNEITLVGVYKTDVRHKDLVAKYDPVNFSASVNFNYGTYSAAAGYGDITATTEGNNNVVSPVDKKISLNLRHKASTGGDLGAGRLELVKK